MLIRTRKIKSFGKYSFLEKGNYYFTKQLEIEEGVYIGPNAQLSANGGLRIKKGTIIGPNVTIYTSNHNFHSENMTTLPYDKETINKKVIINECCWIGGNVVVLPGTEIGFGSVIGGGETVRGIIPPYSIYVGGKVIGQRRNKEQCELLYENQKIYMIEKMRKYENIYELWTKIFRRP
ncbi:acyltransferase [Bacillus haimaensis]|uniref:acyltransferase n=1 Tax=Bacillus haimaensis TaxID=3160967 RepID=UPI003AA8A699